MSIYHENIRKNYSINKRREIFSDEFDHWHQRTEFVYILDGECDIRVGNTCYICKPGDFVVIHSGEVHSFKSDDVCIMYIATFNPGIVYNFQSEVCFLKNYITAEELKKSGLDNELNKTFKEMLDEKTNAMTWNEVVIQADVIRLYSLLVRYFEKTIHPNDKNISRFKKFQASLMYISEHFSENITLEDIAREINYNKTYVSTLFVTYTGVNFKKYLDRIRINKAMELIRNTDLKITDIALKCGYENIRTFNYVFKRIQGFAPTKIRNKQI